MSVCGVIIPTFDNPQYLNACVNSLLSPMITEDILHIYIVNNGIPELTHPYKGHPRITVLEQPSNLGWEGGLIKGIEASKEDFLVFLNDDTFIPLNSVRWINHLIGHFGDPTVGAAGPSSNCVMGVQSIFTPGPSDVFKVNFLIGFCMMVRRSALVAAGGIDASLPGGDDLDLSIRLRRAGYSLVCDKNSFVYHHGFKTGERVEGPPSQKDGWNSTEKIERTNWALIEKHGLRAWLECMNQVPNQGNPYPGWVEDTEGIVCREQIIGERVIEIGCGMRKTVPHAVGVDRVPLGADIPGVAANLKSLADITADAEGQIPVESETFDTAIARHILEHVVDPTKAVKEWGRVIRQGGRLIIAVPNHEIRNTIPMNIEHVHAWTPASLKNFMESQGWKVVDMLDPKNLVSFVGVFTKNGLH